MIERIQALLDCSTETAQQIDETLSVSTTSETAKALIADLNRNRRFRKPRVAVVVEIYADNTDYSDYFYLPDAPDGYGLGLTDAQRLARRFGWTRADHMESQPDQFTFMSIGCRKGNRCVLDLFADSEMDAAKQIKRRPRW